MKNAFPLLTALIVFTGCGRSPSYYLAKGQELFAKQNYSEAALNYRKAIQRDARFGEAYYQLGLTELHLNKGREAYQDLSRAAALLPGRDDVKVTLADFIRLTQLERELEQEEQPREIIVTWKDPAEKRSGLK